jgi:hypothetical protein
VTPESTFRIGESYPHLTGSYEVVAIEDDVLVCRLYDGREMRVSASSALHALELLSFCAPAAEEGQPDRLRHTCEGRPCGTACVKNHGTAG